MTLAEPLKDSAYKLIQFKPEKITVLEVLGLPILNTEVAVQSEISSLVRARFTLKTQSKQWLEAAKRAVEIAIEQDEAAGRAYLTQKMEVT